MKAVILAGGLGSRLSEETITKPKPLVEIGSMPIIWHIMKIYSSYGINNFIICCGYKGNLIKEYFTKYALNMSDVEIDMQANKIQINKRAVEPWKIELVDTGDHTMTGGRLKRIKEYIDGNETFCMTYGDGVADVNIQEVINFHNSHGKIATLTAAYPPPRFGALNIKNSQVVEFNEKPKGDGLMVNGGFFVLNSKVFNYISNDSTVWEQEPLRRLTSECELMAYQHYGFWQPMDTVHDKTLLEQLWEDGRAPWKVW